MSDISWPSLEVRNRRGSGRAGVAAGVRRLWVDESQVRACIQWRVSSASERSRLLLVRSSTLAPRSLRLCLSVKVCPSPSTPLCLARVRRSRKRRPASRPSLPPRSSRGQPIRPSRFWRGCAACPRRGHGSWRRGRQATGAARCRRWEPRSPAPPEPGARRALPA